MRRLGSHEHTPDVTAHPRESQSEDIDMVRRNRPYIYHNFTNSLCPTCLKAIQAKAILQNDKVYMLKTCPDHGPTRTLLSSDPAYYLTRGRSTSPGPLPR